MSAPAPASPITVADHHHGRPTPNVKATTTKTVIPPSTSRITPSAEIIWPIVGARAPIITLRRPIRTQAPT